MIERNITYEVYVCINKQITDEFVKTLKYFLIVDYCSLTIILSSSIQLNIK